MNEPRPEPLKRRWLRIVINGIGCLAILGASAAALVIIQRTAPTAQQIDTRRKSAALVDTVTVERGTYCPQLVAWGTVEPAQDIVLSPRVRGQIVEVSPKFVPGEIVQQGELLLQIDPADFKNAVSIRESELEQAQAALEIEEGRQSLARQELELLGDSIDELNRSLVLREPQYVSIKSQVSAARAALERAELDLQRTRIVAPFDAQIMSRSAYVGSQVGPGDAIAQLVGVEEYWLMAAVPVRSLRWVQFPDSDHDGSSVKLRNRHAWGEIERHARVTRMIGSLDEQSRLARVLITVTDPLGRASNMPPLILDTFIEARIEGKPLHDVVRVDRRHLHTGDTVWVMKNSKLEIRPTTIAFQDAQNAYIRQGLESGDQIVTTTLATVAEGIGLRRIADEPGSATDTAEEPEK